MSARRSTPEFAVAPAVAMRGVSAVVLSNSSCVLQGCMSGWVSTRKK